MNEMTKESKFLDAITRYAEQQKAMIRGELEEYKAQKVEQATDSGLKDAYELIRREVTAQKTAILAEKAQKENALRESLFAERQRICDEVFQKAEERLLAYAETPAYREMLIASVKKIADLIVDDLTVYVRESDLTFSDDIIKIVPTAVIYADPKIRIGGVKIFCHAKCILYDDTLDTRLSDQRTWFVEHSGLKVV